ncbi:hypothetical protein B0O99DRAFT_692324 [Bisporella sp. PMI_857]|nr:hypothetical protein B0O99DRAFT_692324 [Bisporella sp. PMI_857]
MSMDADKLSAISGLAKHMAKKRPRAAYLAGLWSDSLKVDLLSLNSDATSQELDFQWKYPAIWRAPSWSWPAIDSNVVSPYSGYYYRRDEERRSSIVDNYFTINNVRSYPATSDSTGRVGMASITITGRLFPSTLSAPTGDPCPA